MRLDDVGRRAGEDLTSRASRVDVPVLPSGPRRHPATTAVAIALVTGLVVGALVVGVRAVRSDRDSAPAGSTGTWTRYRAPWNDGRSSFSGIVSFDSHFYALSTRTEGRSRQATVWSSSDGRHWTARWHRRTTAQYPQLATNGTRLLIVWNERRRAPTTWSDDGSTWRAGRTLPPTFGWLFGYPGGFSLSQAPDGTSAVRVSTDGRHWSRAVPGTLQPRTRWRSSLVALAEWDGASRLAIGVAPVFPDWSRYPDALPPRTAGPLVASRNRQRLFVIEFEEAPERAGGKLWNSRDPRRPWNEITSFRERFPLGNPDHIVQSGRWWVLGGNRNPGQQRRSTMWVTPDLVHWTEMPAAERGPPTTGNSVLMAAANGIVVGTDVQHFTWIWRPPSETPHLVRVQGTATASGGPVGTFYAPPTVTAYRSGKLVDSTDTAADGSYALDLPPGRYELRTDCGARTTVRIHVRPVTWNPVCERK